jgi:hypothetical protein
MLYLRQSTVQTIFIGPYVNIADGLPNTGLTITSINHVNQGGGGGSTAITAIHRYDGIYQISLPASVPNTAGRMFISSTESGCFPVSHEYTVLISDIYDSMINNSGDLKTDMYNIDGHRTNSGSWELVGRRIDLLSGASGEPAFRARSTEVNTNGVEFQGGANAKDLSAKEIDSILADTNETQQALPVVPPIASQADVQALQNNTRARITVSDPIIIPTTGDLLFPICFGFQNGAPNDPDNNEIAIQARATNSASYKDAFFDNEAGTTPATASTTFTPNYWKMNRVGVGEYSTFYKLPSTESPDQWRLTFKLEESAVEYTYCNAISIVEQSVSVELADTQQTRYTIAKAMKVENVSSEPSTTGSVYKDLKDPVDNIEAKLPAGIISDLALNTPIDTGLTLQNSLELSAAMMDGRILKDSPQPGDLTFYRRDNTTILTITRSTTVDRNRV